MDIQKKAEQAVDMATKFPGNPEPTSSLGFVILNNDGTYSVTDNGEEVSGLSADDAVTIIMENMEAEPSEPVP